MDINGPAVTISSDRLTISYIPSFARVRLSLTLSVNKTMGAMTGLEVDGVDVLGPVSGRIGMGYFDCYCELGRLGSDPQTCPSS